MNKGLKRHTHMLCVVDEQFYPQYFKNIFPTNLLFLYLFSFIHSSCLLLIHVLYSREIEADQKERVVHTKLFKLSSYLVSMKFSFF